MISERLKKLTESGSAIRAMFEEGNRMAALYGRENVYDFSLGNPSIPSPAKVNETILSITAATDPMALHSYMPNAGYPFVRRAVAESLNRRFGTAFSEGNIIMTVGAAGGLNILLQTLLNPGDEVLTFAPYFLEYGNYVQNHGGILKTVPTFEEDGFQPNPAALAAALTPKTKALILNNPNNPTGVVYTAETIRAVAQVLAEKSA
ncbi:MAG: aminotransferase class I/II-fold pyridoxal phosphate-dependent enzyme, partial [bacterium]